MATETAQQAYNRNRAAILDAIEALHVKLETSAIRQSRTPKDWGNVGDLGRIREALEEIA